MSIFDELQEKINVNFSDWIKIVDEKSDFIIDDFPYETGVDEELTKPHCYKSVTSNRCWFKNEADKKPQYFDYSPYSLVQIPLNKRGLFHPNCHCKEVAISTPTENDINLIIPDGKIEWLYRDKIDWVKQLGYSEKDKNEFLKILFSCIKKSFASGKYKIREHNKYGIKITVFIEVPVKNNSENFFKLKSGFSIFSNGKIKCNTLIGGYYK